MSSPLMQIILNGEPYLAPSPCTILQLLSQLGLDPERVAVELNGEIVRRPRWEQTPLESGARLEIVQFVGGG